VIDSAYARLAARLDELPNGFPPAPDGSHLRLLAKLYTPDEAALAAQLRLTLETPADIAPAQTRPAARGSARPAADRRECTHDRAADG